MQRSHPLHKLAISIAFCYTEQVKKKEDPSEPLTSFEKHPPWGENKKRSKDSNRMV
ncbi:MAG: hypothetical protein OXH36_01470 [Bdellovibrionales bacterium]|nr:hypothetical protein [Bdellovibrionales bacterium]